MPYGVVPDNEIKLFRAAVHTELPPEEGCPVHSDPGDAHCNADYPVEKLNTSFRFCFCHILGLPLLKCLMSCRPVPIIIGI